VQDGAALLGKVLPRIEAVEAGLADLAGKVSDQGETINAIDMRLVLVEANPATAPALLAGLSRFERR
jgi:hypothetical protein